MPMPLDSAISSAISAEPGRAEVEAAVAAMTAAERLVRLHRLQEIAVARSWALVERSGLTDPGERLEMVIRSRYPEWSDDQVTELLAAICAREPASAWLDRLKNRSAAIAEKLDDR